MYYIPVPNIITSEQFIDLKPLVDSSLANVVSSEGLNKVMRKFVLLVNWNGQPQRAFLPEYKEVMNRAADGLSLEKQDWKMSFSWLFSFLAPNELPLHIDHMNINHIDHIGFRIPVLLERPKSGAVSRLVTPNGEIEIKQTVGSGSGYGFRADLLPHGFTRFEEGVRTAFGFGFEIQKDAYSLMKERFGFQE